MSFNLIDLVKEQLNDQVKGQLDSILGGTKEQNDSAINSAVPGILNVLTNFDSSDKYASSLYNVINQQDDSILDNLDQKLAGSNRRSILSTGIKSIGSLIGKEGLMSLIGAISTYSGTKKSSTGSLVAVLTHIILSVIKSKVLSRQGTNAKNLIGLFKLQDKNIVAAMPSGFSDSLKKTGSEKTEVTAKKKSPDSNKPLANNKPSTATAKVSQTSAETVKDKTQEIASEKKYMIPKLLAIAVIVGGAIFAYKQFFMGGTSEPEISKTTEISQTSVVSKKPEVTTAKASISNSQIMIKETAEVESELKNTLASLSTSLSSITDIDSAKVALPKLTSATDKLGSLTTVMNKLPDAARGPVKSVIKAGLPQLQALINKISMIPGVGAVVRPVIVSLSEKLAMFN